VESLLTEALSRLYEAFGVAQAFRLTRRTLTVAALRGEFLALKRLRQHTSSRHASRCLECIRERYKDAALTEERIARELGLSTSYLSRLVNHETGRGFRWHLRMIRVGHACELLTSSALSVKEIGAATGFATTSEFDHQFKRVSGVTPSVFRQIHSGGAITTLHNVRNYAQHETL
jgi:AraC-like DNA-binding protein